MVVLVNGKVRDRIEVPRSISKKEMIDLARESPRARAHLEGRTIQQTIPVPGKLVNIVVV